MSISRFFFRGALTGLLGGPLFLIGLTLHDILRTGDTPYGGVLQVMALPPMSFIGLVLGLLIGGMVWIIEYRAGIHLRTIVRGILGASFVFILITLVQLLAGGERGLVQATAMERFINGVMFVTAFGALPAIFALPKSE